MNDSFFVSTGVFVFGDVSGAAVSRRAAGNGADKREQWESDERVGDVGLKRYAQHGAVPQFIVLIGENASWRFSGATFQSTIGRSAVETIRVRTLTAQPFTNLSAGFHGFRASQQRMRL
ncbi:hypothetical protein [Pseudomonas arsenicoxydans]|uniref:hypothetical protein n=1 Tax=Pseudomonas arsenicoxydans TaxID=702115 RepID=UPI00112BD07B|nr:hypothetical protein [Pseudomonas arsenicoxydans]